MGLFSFLKNKSTVETLEKETPIYEIPEDIFIDNSEPEEPEKELKSLENPGGLDPVYEYLQSDFDSRGYSDALTNPDDGYRDDNIKLLMHDFAIKLKIARSYYENLLSDIDLNIKTRSRSGLVDLVMELEERKKLILCKMESIDSMRKCIEGRTDEVERIILSYSRGFMRGLAALTKSGVLNQKI